MVLVKKIKILENLDTIQNSEEIVQTDLPSKIAHKSIFISSYYAKKPTLKIARANFFLCDLSKGKREFPSIQWVVEGNYKTL